MEKLNLVMNAFESAVEHCNKKYRDRVEKLERAWSEANEGLTPNQDRLGRWHSPCDGYELARDLDFPDTVDYDKKYRKGEFLPTPIDYSSDIAHAASAKSARMKSYYRSKDKIKVEEELAVAICEKLMDNSFIEFGHGKSWEVNNVKICYLYLAAHIENAFKYFVDSVKDAIENTDKQIYTGQAIEGRERVTGKIVNVFEEEQLSFGPYGGTEMVKKFLIVLDNDSTCLGNAPSSAYHLGKGDNVEFTATFTKSKKEHHSYYKRPHKMICINEEIENEENCSSNSSANA